MNEKDLKKWPCFFCGGDGEQMEFRGPVKSEEDILDLFKKCEHCKGSGKCECLECEKYFHLSVDNL